MKTLIRLFFGALVLMALTQCQSGGKDVNFEIETPYGTMKGVLYKETPKHQANFIKLAKSGFYDGLLFHRVIQGFMIQGGDPKSSTAQPGQMLGDGGPGYVIDAEIGLPHFKGALAAARQGDQVNPDKKSSGSQFYIVQGQKFEEGFLDQMSQQKGITYTPEQRKRYMEVGGYPPLDNDYTVFGAITEGLDIIDSIAAVPTDQNNRPTENIPMKIRILN
ncbi:MAG: peptidylprolyl isomerase [Saprospiraceae bacterium]|nr:peptidylprolyl isomerase [Saprospiraceae bacterium]HPQ97952.1 peptidylprolyl isomerase [Saprospiraceae bacterium]HQU52098.1 peptidylprolyl isomerase [Saprospiraceae bacterium]